MSVLKTIEHLCAIDIENRVNTFKTKIEESRGFDLLNDLANSPNAEIREKIEKINEHLEM